MNNRVTYVWAYGSDEATSTSRFKSKDTVPIHRRRELQVAFCVSGGRQCYDKYSEPIAGRTRRIGSEVRATRPLRPSTVTKHLGQLARSPTTAVTASRWKGKSSRDADRKGNVCLAPKLGRELSNP